MMSVEPLKSKFETFLFRPDLILEKTSSRLAKVGMYILSSAFGIATFGLVHLGFATKHVIQKNLPVGEQQGSFIDLLTKLNQLRDRCLYIREQIEEKVPNEEMKVLKEDSENPEKSTQNVEDFHKRLSDFLLWLETALPDIEKWLARIGRTGKLSPLVELLRELDTQNDLPTEEQKNNLFRIFTELLKDSHIRETVIHLQRLVYEVLQGKRN